MSDYTDIQQELDDFKNAVYGEEVRGSMVSAIKKIHDTAERAAGAPDASSATAGQVLTADGAGGHYWGNVEAGGDSVPTEVRQALYSLLNNNAFANDSQYASQLAILQSWATEVTSISVSPTTLRMNGAVTEQLVAITQPTGGLVTWESSDTSVADVDAGLVTSIGNGSCTITASCGGKSATCAVTVSGFATLLSIDAVYTQSGTIYDTDTLDSLKSDLVVTANYDDDRSVPVTDYTLSGTLTEGTSTITVAYGGKTTTFNVTVTHTLPDTTAQIETLNYYLKKPADGTGYLYQAGITIKYQMDAPSTTLSPAGVIAVPDGDTLYLPLAASIVVYDSNGDGVTFVNERANSSTTRWVRFVSDTTEFTQTWSVAEYTQIAFSVDTRCLDYSYMYDKTTGQVWFAGVNTPYYGMSNISEAT